MKAFVNQRYSYICENKGMVFQAPVKALLPT